jgi:hypothetical protein
MTTPNYDTALTAVVAALKAILAEVTPNVPVIDATMQTLSMPYWTIYDEGTTASTAEQPGAGMFRIDQRLGAWYHAGFKTAGAPGKVEDDARRVGREAFFTLQQRRYLQSATVQAGVLAIDPSGVTVADLALLTLTRDGAADLIIAARVNLTVPQLFQFDYIDIAP